MTADHAGRRDRLRGQLPEHLAGRVLVLTDLANVRYLSGFSGSNAVLVIDPGGTDLLATDGRYRDQAAEQSPDLPVMIDRNTLGAVAEAIANRAIAVEGSLSIAEADALRASGHDVAVATELVERLRMVKDEVELAAVSCACAITVEALGILVTEMRPGVSELRLARRLEQLFGELGAEDRAFETIVGSGPNSAIPHHEPGSRVLATGDLVVVDAGARVDGYHADMTRTFVVGDTVLPWQEEIHALVLASQAAATAGYLPGATLPDVDALARDIIDAAGYAEQFGHGLGHGVGLQIHEAPMIGTRATGTLEGNMAITVEPGVYLTGRGGVRIEDTLVVTDAGPRVLTEAPRGLVAVG